MRVLSVILSFTLAAAQAALPPLPKVPLDSFPAATREAITRPYKDANARPGDADSVGALARALHAWEQWSTADAAYRRAQALAPRAFEWHYLDAVVLQRLARHADAATQLEEALRITPDYLPARVKLAEARLESSNLTASAPLFESLLQEPAARPAAEMGLGRIEAAQGHHAAAVEHLQRAIALFPEWGAAHYALALSYRALGRRDEAQRELERQIGRAHV